MDMARMDRYLEENLERSLAELSRLVAQPSVSAQNWGLAECAGLVGEMLERRGFRVEIHATSGAPVVFAERAGRGGKTLLFYNHYDVQPPEPLELWESPPFEPSLRDGKLYGRGVSDDKAHITYRLLALDAFLEITGELPCAIKFLIEGEEETSSVHLGDFVRQHAGKLAADACIWEFGGVDHRDVPMQHLGVRGICYVELSVETANQDLHSGLGGSIIANAAWRLTWALNSLKGPDERIRIRGFYDHVKPPSARDEALLAALPDEADELRSRYGIREFLGGTPGGVALMLQEIFQPTCTICGLTAGYQGTGSKTVLPARASAKVDFRLVPEQTPAEVLEKLRAHLDAEGFADVQITFLGGDAAAKTDPDDPFVKLMVDTAAPVYGQPMQIIPMVGGSGPNHTVGGALKVPIVSHGLGYPGTNGHAPNENIRLDLYLKAARHLVRVLDAYGQGG